MRARLAVVALAVGGLFASTGGRSAEAGCVRPEHVYFYDAGQNTSVDVALATRTVVFTTRDGRELRGEGAVVVDDGRRLTVTYSQPDLKISMRADLPYGRVRALATELRPPPEPTTSRVVIRSRNRVKNWTVVSYGGPSQEGTCGHQVQAARATSARR